MCSPGNATVGVHTGAATRGPGTEASGDPLDGRLVAGAPANLVLFRENPFDSLSALDEIEAVILRGRHLDRVALDGILRSLESAAAEAP
jgi:hypothetical protein